MSANNSNNIHVSVVSPVYKAEKIVDELVRQLTFVLQKITDSYEIILVEDCGPDLAWDKIQENCQNDPKVKGLKLSKNFGQHHAITAGLDYSRGDWVVVMDCDLQDLPEEIVKLYNEAIKGYDLVLARRIERNDKFIKRFTSALFYKVFSYLSGIKHDSTVANFGIYSRKVINALCVLREPTRSFTAMVSWVGFKRSKVDVKHGERFEGNTSYNWGKLIDLAIEIAISYSQKPLKITIKLGLVISLLSIIFTIYNIYMYFAGKITVSGYTSLIISIWFLSGLIIVVIGIVGLYIGKIFEAIKKRPIYLVDKAENIDAEHTFF